MKKIITALSVVLLMAACSDSGTGNSDFESYKVGSWLVTSPQTAQWEGRTANKKTTINTLSSIPDTVYFDKPKANSLRIYHVDSVKHRVFMQYTDSSYTEAYFDTTNANHGGNAFCDLTIQNGGGGTLEGPFLIDFGISFNCDSTYTDFDGQLMIRMFADTPGQYYRAFLIDMQGFTSTVRSMMCN